MLETKTGNLIKQSESLALQEINRLSKVDGEVLTKNEVVERIKDINHNIAIYDLIVESETFSSLVSITNEKLPRLKDRIYTATKYLYSLLDDDKPNIIYSIEEVGRLLFGWNKTISKKVEKNIKDLKDYINCKDNESLKICTINLINNYNFRNDLYKYAQENFEHSEEIRNKYLDTIVYIEQLGPLVTIYESFKSEDSNEVKKLDILIAVIKYTFNHTGLNSTHIPHIIPALLRSVVRKNKFSEEEILGMRIYQIIEHSKDDEVGKIILLLARSISIKDKDRLVNSKSGERLYIELESVKFWEKLEYLPELSLLEHITMTAERLGEIFEEKEQSKNRKLSQHAGELNQILHP